MKNSLLTGKVLAIAMIFLISLPCLGQSTTDLQAEGMLLQMLPPIPGETDSFFDVSPEVIITSNDQTDMPLHADLYVNNILVAQDQMHMFRAAGGGNGCPTSCIGGCQIDVWHPGGPVIMYAGNCVTLTPSGCTCQTGPIEMWPLQGIPLQAGDILRLVLDPQDLIPETDETNNELILPFEPLMDILAVDLDFLYKGPGAYDVQPIVDLGIHSLLSWPLDADIYVNGALVGQDRMHRVKEAGGQCPVSNCIGNCQIDIWHPGGPVIMHQGICVPLTQPDGCYCFVSNKSLWPVENIALTPGDEVTIVLDPENKVPEVDETNNTLTTTWLPRNDYLAESIEYTCVGNGLYHVRSQVATVDADAMPKPMHSQLFVNGVLVAGNSSMGIATEVNCPTDGSSCSGRFCSWAYTGWETTRILKGRCAGPAGPKCDCKATIPNCDHRYISIEEGDEVTIIIDPENLIEEADEGNNIYTETFTEPECVCGIASPLMPQPVDLTKSFAPVPWPDGVVDRVQVKWFKDIPEVRFQPEDGAACDIQFWKVKDHTTGQFFPNPDTLLMPKNIVQKPGKEFFKWPIKFKSAEPSSTIRVDPNCRYKWRVRCYCDGGNGLPGPWSQIKFFNTPPFDPITGIYTPPPGILNEFTKSLDPNELFKLFPNPNDGSFQLQVEFPEDGNLRIEMIDLTGRVVNTSQVTAKEGIGIHSLDFSQLPNGIYIINGVLNDNALFRTTVMIE